MSDAWLGFLGGVFAALVGGLIASLIQRHNEEKRRLEEARAEIYFLLMELNSQYFWVASSELHGEPPDQTVLTSCRTIAWKIADRLRLCDRVEFTDQILDVLFNVTTPSANVRANKLNDLIERYGKIVNPKYSQHISKISKTNILSIGSGEKIESYAPGSWR